VKPVDVETRLRQFVWPAPRPSLRAQVLAEAPVTSPAVSWSDRVWFSRAWRVAAVLAFVALAGLELLSGPARSSISTMSPQVAAEASMVEETARQAGLSPEQAAVLGRRAAATETKAGSGARSSEIGLDGLDSGGEPR
jgi:hypothetical protein